MYPSQCKRNFAFKTNIIVHIETIMNFTFGRNYKCKNNLLVNYLHHAPPPLCINYKHTIFKMKKRKEFTTKPSFKKFISNNTFIN